MQQRIIHLDRLSHAISINKTFKADKKDGYRVELANNKLTITVADASDIELTGELTAAMVELCINAKGKVIFDKTANLTCKKLKIAADKDVVIAGKIAIEDKAAISTAEEILVIGSLSARGVELTAKYLRIINNGCITGSDNVKANVAFGTFLAYAASICGTSVSVISPLYINLFGFVQAYDFNLDSFVPLDIGLSMPTMPSSWAATTNSHKQFYVVRKLSYLVAKPFGSLVKILYKLNSAYEKCSQGLQGLFHKSAAQSHQPEKLATMKGLLRFKSAMFAMLSVYFEMALLAQMIDQYYNHDRSEPVGLQHCVAAPVNNTIYDDLNHVQENLCYVLPAFLPSFYAISPVAFFSGIRGPAAVASDSFENISNDAGFTFNLCR